MRTRIATAAVVTASAFALSTGSPGWQAPVLAASALQCDGRVATIVGTSGADHITGTPGADVIVAGRGWDHVNAGAGNDVVCGGSGADHLSDGPGNDRIFGQGDGLLYNEDQYGDVLVDGPGRDLLDGGAGLYGSDRGLDELHFPNARIGVAVDLEAQTARAQDRVVSIELVYGTPYADHLLGDSRFEEIFGGPGDDYVVGRGGIDFLYGDSGDDRLRGGRGNDYLDGGDNRDVGRGGPSGRRGDYCVAVEVRFGCEH